MQLPIFDLPPELIASIFDQIVFALGLKKALLLRLVNKNVEQEISEAIARLDTCNVNGHLPLPIITRHLFLQTTPKDSSHNDLASYINNVAKAFESLEDDPNAAVQLRDAARFELCKLLTEHNGASKVLRLLKDYQHADPCRSQYVSDEFHSFITCAISLDLTHIVLSVKGGWACSGFHYHRLPSPISLASRSPHRRQLFDLLLAREDCGDVVALSHKHELFAAWREAASHGNSYAAHKISRRFGKYSEHVPAQFVVNKHAARKVARPLIESNDLQSMKDLVLLVKQARRGDIIGDVIVTEACRIGNLDMLGLALVDLKVTVDACSDESPLVEAAARGYACLLPLLKEKCRAAWESDRGTMLLEAGISGWGCIPRAFAGLGETRTTFGRAYTRVLHVATEVGNCEFVGALVDCFGMPDNIRGQYKVARLAASLGHDSILRILAARGCYLGSPNPEWVPSPLLWAMAYGHRNTMQSLLELGEAMEDPLKSPLKERFRTGYFPKKKGRSSEKARYTKWGVYRNDGYRDDESRGDSSDGEIPAVSTQNDSGGQIPVSGDAEDAINIPWTDEELGL